MRRVLVGVTAALAVLTAAPAQAQAPTPTVEWTDPHEGEVVSGVLTSAEQTCRARIMGEVRAVRYYVDGRLADTERAAPWGQCRIDTRDHANGAHTFRVEADPVPAPPPANPGNDDADPPGGDDRDLPGGGDDSPGGGTPGGGETPADTPPTGDPGDTPRVATATAAVIADEVKVVFDNPPPPPLAVEWQRPNDNQVVSGFLRESNDRCLARPTVPIARAEIYVDGFLNDVQARAPWGCELDTRRYPNGVHKLTYRVIGTDGKTAEANVTVLFRNEDPPVRPNPPERPTVEEPAPGQPPVVIIVPDPEQAPVVAPAPSQPPPLMIAPPPAPPTQPTPQRPSQTRYQAEQRATTTLKRGMWRRDFSRRLSATYRVKCRRTGRASHSCRVSWLTRTRRYSGVVTVRDVTDDRDWTYASRITSRLR